MTRRLTQPIRLTVHPARLTRRPTSLEIRGFHPEELAS